MKAPITQAQAAMHYVRCNVTMMGCTPADREFWRGKNGERSPGSILLRTEEGFENHPHRAARVLAEEVTSLHIRLREMIDLANSLRELVYLPEIYRKRIADAEAAIKNGKLSE
jgi:hypothetical protein